MSEQNQRAEAAKRYAATIERNLVLYENEREAFAGALSHSIITFGIKPEMISEELGVTVDTVRRWMNNESSPRSLVRRAIIEMLTRELIKFNP